MYEDFPKITDFHRIFSEELPELEEDVHTADISYSKGRAVFFSSVCIVWSQTQSYVYLLWQEGRSPKSVLLVASTLSVDLY